MVLSIIAAAIVLLPLALASVFFLRNIFKSKWSNDSYPPVAATIVGHILNFKRVHDFYADHHYRYKTYRLAYPTHSYVYTTDPANVEYILKTNFTNYGRENFNHEIMADFFGDGIFTVDGEKWKQQRKLASLEFSTRVLKDFSSVVFRKSAVELCGILLEACRTNQIVEMQDAKHVDSDDTLPDGYRMKKGDLVNYVPYSMGRMEYLWGADAKEFKPERWLENGVFQSQSPFKFTAFQAGPRICLGKEFAYLQMKIVAAVLLRFFKFEAVEGKEVTYQPSLTLHMNEDGLNVRIICRSDIQ